MWEGEGLCYIFNSFGNCLLAWLPFATTGFYSLAWVVTRSWSQYYMFHVQIVFSSWITWVYDVRVPCECKSSTALVLLEWTPQLCGAKLACIRWAGGSYKLKWINCRGIIAPLRVGLTQIVPKSHFKKIKNSRNQEHISLRFQDMAFFMML